MSDKWTLLITGTDHGLVGAFGNKFAAHPDWYERVDVVRADHHAELVEALRAFSAAVLHPDTFRRIQLIAAARHDANKLLAKLETNQ
jgi:hypothetical protein